MTLNKNTNAKSSQKLSELKKHLESNDISVSRIIELSHEIAALDSNKTRFSVDAGIIDRLGKELVSKKETAVSELVKNSYDADATEVKLVFVNSDKKGGTLKIIDNGSGMTKSELINGFMRLASSNKIHEPRTKKFKRKKAGKKGIGRFSTQRLSSKLTILTKTENSNTTYKISIDWNKYEVDTNIFLVEHEINNIEYEWNSTSGTILILDDLRDSWTETTIKRVYRFTGELLQPYPLIKGKVIEEKIDDVDPGFKTYYYSNSINESNIIVDDETEIFQYALAEIKGYVDDNGQGYWVLNSNKIDGFTEDLFLIGNSEKKDDDSSPFNFIKGIEFHAYYFMYEPKLFPKGQMTLIRNLAHERGGIRLYRNKFRVLPYGEPKDDWLGLDKSTSRQVILASHRNFNFFGFVQLKNNLEEFEETASREGLIENNAYTELTNFVYRCIVNAVQKVSHLRNRKATASQKDFISEKNRDPIHRFENLLTQIRNVELPANHPLKEKLEKLDTTFQEHKIKQQELIDENNMLRVLAGLGLVIGEFVHEIKRFLPSFNNEIHFLEKALTNDKKALKHIYLLDDHLNSFKVYTSFFDHAISRNTLRELETIELRDAVRSFEDAIRNDIKKLQIDFTIEFNGYDLFTIPMHPSEWASILFNLYSNSKKAIQRSKVSQGKIDIFCGRDGNNVFLEFSDNGDGIQESNKDFIFDAFYTTSSAIDADDEISSLTGTGLGLKIVNDIIESYKGEIYLTSPKDGFTTTFRIEIPEGEEYE